MSQQNQKKGFINITGYADNKLIGTQTHNTPHIFRGVELTELHISANINSTQELRELIDHLREVEPTLF